MAGKAKGRGKNGNAGATIVIRREEGGGHGHHGGAWKVAYADFVTAMMAFFLLMWLLNATSEEQRRGLADYFAPTNVLAAAQSGSGQPFGGKTPTDKGAAVSSSGAVRVQAGPVPIRLDVDDDPGDKTNPPDATLPPVLDDVPAGTAKTPAKGGPEPGTARPGTDGTEAGQPQGEAGSERGAAAKAAASLPDAALQAELTRRERAAFERAAAEIREAVAADPTLADIAKQLLIEQVPEGLRIQLLDAERQPMFAFGNPAPNERGRALLAKVAQVIAKLPNGILIAGHTDAAPFRGGERSNWDLSAERANAARRWLLEQGVTEGRLQSVTGQADRSLLLPDQPMAAGNRRVAITLLRSLPDAAPEAPRR
jgi:chemotaxis protein MotB